MTPLETAMLIARSEGKIARDPATGLYTVGATSMTLAQYESGMQILQLREKLAIAQTPR